MNKEIIKRLKEFASQSSNLDYVWEEFNPYEMFGGNIDDSYYGGFSDGHVDLARELLNMMGIDY